MALKKYLQASLKPVSFGFIISIAGLGLPNIAHAKPNMQTPYSKPGAAVKISHDYSGHSDVGVPQDILVTFRERASTGTLSVKILASEGLDVLTVDDMTNFQMSEGDTHTMNVTVTSLAEGAHNLSILVISNQGRGKVSRQSRGIVIRSGMDGLLQKSESVDTTKLKMPQSPTASEKVTPTNRGIIVMDATEKVIR